MYFALYVYIITFVLFLSKFVYKASLKNNVLIVYNHKPKCICICTHGAIYVFCLICLNHNIYFVLSNLFIKWFLKNVVCFVLVYNLKSKSFCLQSIRYVLCLICLNQNIYFVLLKFKNNIACIKYIYFQVFKY